MNPLFLFLIQLSLIGLPLSVCLLSPPHVYATPSDQFSTTTTFVVLNVTAALHQARQVLSFKPSYDQLEEGEQQTHIPVDHTPTSSLKFQLHPKKSHHHHHHYKNYRSLVLSRLNHDSARVKSILSKYKYNNNSSSLLQAPLRTDYAIGGPGYVARIGLGQPAKGFDIFPDTGSDLTWLQCKPCIHCYNQTDPIFDPSTSSSYSPINCGDKYCKELGGKRSSCNNNYCEYTMDYADRSITKGAFVTETLMFGNSSINQVAIGCAHDSKGTFVATAGILGLGRGPLSFPAQINASSFSYCLVDRDSNRSSTLDFNFNSPRLPNHSLTAPLLRNPKVELDMTYFAGFTGVSVGGEKVPVPPETFKIDPSTGFGGIIIDSGTTITYLQTAAYNKVRDVFVAKTQHLRRAKPDSLFDTCYDLSSEKTVRVPTVAFETSDGRLWTLPVSGVLYQMDDDKATFCFAFVPVGVPVSVLGNVQQQGTRISFDLANSLVAFSPHNC